MIFDDNRQPGIVEKKDLAFWPACVKANKKTPAGRGFFDLESGLLQIIASEA